MTRRLRADSHPLVLSLSMAAMTTDRGVGGKSLLPKRRTLLMSKFPLGSAVPGEASTAGNQKGH
ncbi:MAG TPA: hypothetical protein VGO92_01155, partial [Acidimicrobiales bacterium]|nr:hypothetical protein [Acidimicrobiales bacterium]